ncbi:MAG: alpha-amylase family glycosyl hydrolase [Ktedonobacterales bacterium]
MRKDATMAERLAGKPLWWQAGVVYQIYPRSFLDSDGDGDGDLPGIHEKLDYLVWLGVDAVWLSPIFPSPMADFGYDVANYVDVDPLFGTLADLDRLIAGLHARGIKLLLDLVPNHTSDEHPWFVESRASRDNLKRDWYLWRDPRPDGRPPNNWLGAFGGGAWTLDPTTGQYYLHLFDRKQPDLNWRNPAVRQAIYDVMRFWFARGVDGFRIDVVSGMIKDELLRDNSPNPVWRPGDPPWQRQLRNFSANQPEVHDVLREMRAVADEFPERVLVGEAYLPMVDLMDYYGTALDECHLPFNFQLLELPWNARTIGAAITAYEDALPPGAWPNWVLSNHDRSRVASRVGPQHARLAQMLLLTLRGTPTCYYGDEIGMADVPIPPERIVDPPGLLDPAVSRDPARTPMQWDSSPCANFTTGQPWLPLATNYPLVNVAAERADPRSVLALVRRLLALRRASAALALGSYRALAMPSADVLAYVREAPGERLLVALNFGATPRMLDFTAHGLSATGTLRCSTHLDREDNAERLDALALRAGEGVVLALDVVAGGAAPAE